MDGDELQKAGTKYNTRSTPADEQPLISTKLSIWPQIADLTDQRRFSV